MAYLNSGYWSYEKITLPQRRFWWIIKLCRLLLKFSGDPGHDETWERRIERKDGTEEYQFFIKVVMRKPRDEE